MFLEVLFKVEIIIGDIVCVVVDWFVEEARKKEKEVIVRHGKVTEATVFIHHHDGCMGGTPESQIESPGTHPEPNRDPSGTHPRLHPGNPLALSNRGPS